jgi:ATP-dependent Clp protease ATP-binding subunit ClpB
MTSNLGGEAIAQAASGSGQGEARRQAIREGAMEALRHAVRPEFLNRIDDIIVFEPLEADSIGRIAELQFAKLAERLADQGITATLTDTARDALAERGYDPVYGARPLRRLVQKEIAQRLAQAILAGGFGDGDAIDVGHDGTDFVFDRIEKPEQALDPALESDIEDAEVIEESVA